MKQSSSRFMQCVLASVFLVVCDQLSKHMAFLHLKGKDDVVLLPGVLRLHYLYPENRGIAFGMFQGSVTVFGIVSILLIAAFLAALYRVPKNRYYLPLMIGGILIISGAAGNVIDRLGRQYVIDFIYFELIDFPLFNLADVFVVCGAFLSAILCIFRYTGESDFSFLRRSREKDRK